MGGPTQAGTSGVFLQDESTGLSPDVIATNGYNGLITTTPGHVSTDNSTTDTLNADAVFTGEWEEITNYGIIVLSTTSNVASAADGVMVQFSTDGTVAGIISDDEYTLSAGAKKTWSFQAAAKYYRVVYTNGGTNQTSFNLQTVLKPYYVKPSSHRIQDAIVDDDDAELVKAVITGQRPDDVFVNFQSTTAGNFKISVEEFDAAVSTVMAGFTDNLDGEDGLNIAAGMYGRASDTLLVPIKVDGSTQDIQCIDHEHAEIHGGDHYNYYDYQLNNGLGAIIEFVLTTPNTTKWGHFTFELFSSTGATIELYEGTSGVTGGTSITPRNNNRNSSNTADITIVKDPASITSDGTRAAGFLAGANRQAGFIARRDENVLKQNEIYLVRITSLAASNNIGWGSKWYEHTDKN